MQKRSPPIRPYSTEPVVPVFGVVPDCVPVEPVAPEAPPLWFIRHVQRASAAGRSAGLIRQD